MKRGNGINEDNNKNNNSNKINSSIINRTIIANKIIKYGTPIMKMMPTTGAALLVFLILLCTYSYAINIINNIIDMTSYKYSINVMELFTIFIVPILAAALYIIWNNKKTQPNYDNNMITLGRPVPPIDYVCQIKQLSATVMEKDKIINTERKTTNDEIKKLKSQVRALTQQNDSLAVVLENEREKRLKLEQNLLPKQQSYSQIPFIAHLGKKTSDTSIKLIGLPEDDDNNLLLYDGIESPRCGECIQLRKDYRILQENYNRILHASLENKTEKEKSSITKSDSTI